MLQVKTGLIDLFTFMGKHRTQEGRAHAGMQVLTHLERDLHFLLQRRRDVLGKQVLRFVICSELFEIWRHTGGRRLYFDAPLPQRLGENRDGKTARLGYRVGNHLRRLAKWQSASHGDGSCPIGIDLLGRIVEIRLGIRLSSCRMIDKLYVSGPGRNLQIDWHPFFLPRTGDDIDNVVIHHNGRDDHVSSQLTVPFREKTGIHQHAAFHTLDSFVGDLLGKFMDNK